MPGRTFTCGRSNLANGAFALGPLAGLRGEITVIDGEAYIARADEDR